ncbi:MAG TPA: repressor LexA, partial [Peptococcaceae bacterium]|nr:repressor LexA [Peptococcaceae bacterium]
DMHPGEKIRKLRRAAGYTQAQLAAAAGLSQQYLSDIETGRHRPSLRALETIAAALKTPAAGLLETPGTRAAAAPPGAVPLLGRVPGGPPYASEENVLAHLVLPPRVAGPRTFCLEVTGDSMRDMGIAHGDYLIVRAQETADNGQVVVARVHGEVTCKRIYCGGGRVRLEPANPAYRAMEVDAGDVRIVGVVTGIIKRL